MILSASPLEMMLLAISISKGEASQVVMRRLASAS